MSTAGARHLAASKIWMAAQQQEKQIPYRGAPLIETAMQHMDPMKVRAFLIWLEDALEAERR